MGKAFTTNGQIMNTYRILVGKPEGRTSLGRPKFRWRIILKCSYRDRIWWYGLDWSSPGRGPVEGAFEYDNEPSSSIKFWEVFLLAERLAASDEGCSSVELEELKRYACKPSYAAWGIKYNLCWFASHMKPLVLCLTVACSAYRGLSPHCSH
jgi:hypothetical protein